MQLVNMSLFLQKMLPKSNKNRVVGGTTGVGSSASSTDTYKMHAPPSEKEKTLSGREKSIPLVPPAKGLGASMVAKAQTKPVSSAQKDAAPAHREKQLEILRKTADLLLSEKFDGGYRFSDIVKLPATGFDSDLRAICSALRGLFNFRNRMFNDCIKDLATVLDYDPKNRTALLYTLLASCLGIRQVSISKQIAIEIKIKNEFHPSQEDIFGRLMRVLTLTNGHDEEQVKDVLLALNKDSENNFRIFSALAADSLQAFRCRGLSEDRESAIDFACKSLALNWDDPLAFSTLYNLTGGAGHGSFAPLTGTRDSNGSYRQVFHVAECDHRAITLYADIKQDETLRQDLAAWLTPEA